MRELWPLSSRRALGFGLVALLHRVQLHSVHNRDNRKRRRTVERSGVERERGAERMQKVTEQEFHLTEK